MLRTRLDKLEKILQPKVKGDPIFMCNIFPDRTYEHEGQKFANEQEFIKATNAKNIIYYFIPSGATNDKIPIIQN